MKVLNKGKGASLAWRQLNSNQFVHDLRTPLKFKLRLAVKKNTYWAIFII